MDVDAKSSHLSLMRFTYLAEEELSKFIVYFTPVIHCIDCYILNQNLVFRTIITVLMSTNIYTKKYEMLEKQNGVALLIHDFSEGSNSSSHSDVRLTGEYSITLNGTCSVVRDGEDELNDVT